MAFHEQGERALISRLGSRHQRTAVANSCGTSRFDGHEADLPWDSTAK